MNTSPMQGSDPTLLVELIETPMPFGKYKGCIICDMPVHYLEWFSNQGFPDSRLGQLLALAFEIKINGLEEIIRELKKGKR